MPNKDSIHKSSGVKRRILIIHTGLYSRRGDVAVAVWMIEALKKEYDLTLLTWAPVDFIAINRDYGTSLYPSDLEISIMPAAIRHMLDLIPNARIRALHQNMILMRWCKFIRRRYDLLMTAENEFDFGSRGIQYVHFPHQARRWMQEPLHHRGLRYLISFMKTRIHPWRIISGYSFERMHRNKTLVNSEWTRNRFREAYGVDATTVYPPVPGDFPNVPWEEREVGFVCIGRISTWKRQEEIIDILTAMRSFAPEVHLHIIGSAAGDTEGYERVRKRVEANDAWVFLHENVSRDELTDLICRHRYGIHGKVNEHFGIAVAEMMRGGCIVFVPDSGGQVEIVGNEERLLYHTTEEAVAKILRVMTHPQEETELRDHLGLRKDLFTAERFVQRIQEEVADFLDHSHGDDRPHQ